MRGSAAVLLLAALAGARGSPTASPFPECPVGIHITTPAYTPPPSSSPSAPPTTPPSASPSSPPTTPPTASPTASPLPPAPPLAFGITAAPRPYIQSGGISNYSAGGENDTAEGLCRCETFGKDTRPFLDRNDSYCGNTEGMLAAWEGAVHFACPHCMASGTAINITCPNHWETCELLLNLYVCPGCSSNGGQTTTGMWPASLAADGWTAAGRCTGSFCEAEGGREHPLVGFHKQILGGDTEMLPETASTTMYFSLLVKEGTVCDQVTNEAQCAAAPLCRWSATGSSCHLDWCPVEGGNNPASCAPCAPGTPEGVCQA